MIATLPDPLQEAVEAREVLKQIRDAVSPFAAPEMHWQYYAGHIENVLSSYCQTTIPTWIKPALDIWTGKADR